VLYLAGAALAYFYGKVSAIWPWGRPMSLALAHWRLAVGAVSQKTSRTCSVGGDGFFLICEAGLNVAGDEFVLRGLYFAAGGSPALPPLRFTCCRVRFGGDGRSSRAHPRQDQPSPIALVNCVVDLGSRFLLHALDGHDARREPLAVGARHSGAEHPRLRRFGTRTRSTSS